MLGREALIAQPLENCVGPGVHELVPLNQCNVLHIQSLKEKYI